MATIREDYLKTNSSEAKSFDFAIITVCSKKMWYFFLRPSPSLGRRRFRVRVLCLVTVEQGITAYPGHYFPEVPEQIFELPAAFLLANCTLRD